MAINDVWQLSVKGTVLSQEHIHTLHFRDKTGLAAPTAIITVWQATCRTTYRGMFGSGDLPVVTHTVRQVCGTPPFAASGEATEPGGTQAGTRAMSGDGAPSWLARCISWRTAYAGRRFRGRSFIGGMFESMMSGNELTAGETTIMDAYVAAVIGAFGPSGSSADWAAVVYSQTARDAGSSCSTAASQIAAGLSRTAIASMRSRKPGHGN
jgi:hypothetical protein